MVELLNEDPESQMYSNLGGMGDEEFKRAFLTVLRLYKQPLPDGYLKNEMAAFVKAANLRKMYDLAAIVNEKNK